jgi:FKBP-type peptidyl-prolyl cis-trans isomerase FkpA
MTISDNIIQICRQLFFTALTGSVLLLAGCVKNDNEKDKKRENELIKKYLDDNGISTDTKTDGGIYFVEDVAGTGLSPVKNDFVIVNYTGRYLEGNVIHETTYKALESEWPASSTFKDYVYGPAKFQAGYSISGINEGLSLMKEGGKATMVLPSEKAFYDDNPMVYEIELLKVIKDPVASEDLILTAYLNSISYGDTTFYNGIYYNEDTVGHGNFVASGDTVFFWFKGTLVDAFSGTFTDDRVFDSNFGDAEPLKLVLGKSSALSGVILSIPKGLNTALDTLRVDSYAKVVLPYTEAFGDKGLINSVYRYTIVPKYQTVVYYIKIKDIRPGAKK